MLTTGNFFKNLFSDDQFIYVVRNSTIDTCEGGGEREKQLGIDSPVAEVREGSKVEVSAGQTYNIRGNIMQYIYIYIYTVQYSIQHLPHLSRNI